ncbi:MAG: YicC family protein [Acidobacteria bacterium]|nr:YicC family protein [Acidobacteriota bacterium]MCI0621998.1 YicC family protein [Acidobacteriota bacterium]MCI0723382.1 YicC family protein [Acidobacteriota bacterium]
MIKSMTGFGRGRHEGEAFACTVELKSVNHRFLDPHLRLPAEFAGVELKLKRLIQSRIKRGRLDLFLNIERNQTVEFSFNEPVLQAYLKAIEKLKTDFLLAGELDLVQLLRVPGIMNLEGMSLSSEGRQQIEDGVVQAAELALTELERMRVDEGVALRNDIVTRLGVIQERVEVIRRQIHGALNAYQERLKVRLGELLRGTPVDPNRLVQEAAFYVERSDISEEVTRLQSHLEQCEALLSSGEEAGKTLDFLLQEMNREANTILSKTTGLTGNGLEIANAAIVIKTEVEKIREQVQNIE